MFTDIPNFICHPYLTHSFSTFHSSRTHSFHLPPLPHTQLFHFHPYLTHRFHFHPYLTHSFSTTPTSHTPEYSSLSRVCMICHKHKTGAYTHYCVIHIHAVSFVSIFFDFEGLRPSKPENVETHTLCVCAPHMCVCAPVCVSV